MHRWDSDSSASWLLSSSESSPIGTRATYSNSLVSGKARVAASWSLAAVRPRRRSHGADWSRRWSRSKHLASCTAPEPRAWHPRGGAPVAPRIFRGLGPGAAAFSRRNPRWRRTPIGVAITGASATLAASETCNTARSSPRADSERCRYSGPGVLSSRPAHTTAAPSQRRMRQRLAGPREPHPSANTAAQAEGL